MPALTVAHLAEYCGGRAEGDTQRQVTGANALELAGESDLSFAASAKALEATKTSRAGCLLVPSSFRGAGPWSLIFVEDPRSAFARAVTALYPKTRPEPFIHPTAIIASTAQIGKNCSIGPYTVIGNDSHIAEGCSIANNCSVGDRVSIAEDTIIHPNVTIYSGVRIGARVIIHSGCVLGADGFGFTFTGDHYEKFPQIGTVEIGDDVEVGANCCIDRAALGVTRIGAGAKLDNLVHVAHNCEIGKHVVVAAQTGFSGSIVVGDYAVIGGQVGIGEKAKIEPKAIIGGKAGILSSQIVHAGEPVWGIPARPLRQHLKGLAHLAKLADMRNELKELKRTVARLEERNRKG